MSRVKVPVNIKMRVKGVVRAMVDDHANNKELAQAVNVAVREWCYANFINISIVDSFLIDIHVPMLLKKHMRK